MRARCGMWRGEAATDAELDAQVRAVLVLSGDFNPPEIARATGFSEATVELDPEGCRHVAKFPVKGALGAAVAPKEAAK